MDLLDFEPSVRRKRQKVVHDNPTSCDLELETSFDLATTDAADVRLRVGLEGQELKDMPFSRFPLAAQSPVFRRMLYGSMAESKPGSVVRVEFSAETVETFLRGICSGEMLLDDDNVCDMCRLADFYQVKGLKRVVEKYIAENLDCGTASRFLGGLGHISGTRDGLIHFVLKNTDMCLLGSRVHLLTKETLLEIVQAECISITELELFHAVIRWGRDKNILGPQHVTAEIVAPLMEHIRFPLLRACDLANVVEPTGLVCKELLYEAFLGKNKQQKPTGVRFRRRFLSLPFMEPATQDSAGIVTHGLFHYLGTQANTRDYANPSEDGTVIVTWSSVQDGHSIQKFVGLHHDACVAFTGDTRNSWMQVDLGESLRCIPRWYALRDGMATPRPSMNNVLRNWTLEARTRQTENWTELSTHVDDPSLTHKLVATWETAVPSAGFRYFRVRQTGLNSSERHYLLCSGFELWGDIYAAESWCSLDS
eukprot:TRINITY_DN27302_c0_g1_i1.p1 TRINITY_DN27302_c0_g1~~TRINITY_DN27302_c0_g1_i1.p1  ORF type:complete len:496 (-),score=58.00 TRINITY_DN27302_c0_g1_i1:66-1505(-)